MKKESHSSISTYLDCQKKYELIYVKHLKTTNEHFQFGSMAHKVLETNEIPDEIMYPELKEFFGIKSWTVYFTQVLNELNEFLKDYEVIGREIPVEDDKLKGVIDLALRDKETNRIVLCDYKFSNSVKAYDDLELDEQLSIYAGLYCENFKEQIDNIDICYISIPKHQIDYPRILNNGTLSKDKNQNTTYEMFMEKIIELGLNVEDYEEILNVYKNKKFLQIYKNRLNLDMLERIYTNIDLVLKDMEKGYYLEKCSYMCKSCPYIQYCKYNKEIITDDV